MKTSALSLPVLALSLCSCGVYQAVHDEDSTQGYSFLGLNPVSAITGTSDTTTENFKPFSYYTKLIRTRNTESATPARIEEILVAMDRCFRDPSVKKMSERQIISLFGPADKMVRENGELTYFYEIEDGSRKPGRWLVTP
jgi:hypothetical protein